MTLFPKSLATIAAALQEIECRACGCTDSHACVTDAGPCCWVLLDVDAPTGICSACAEHYDWHPLLFAAYGRGGPNDPAAQEHL